MEDMAVKLCEAVENEDADEVENLLKCGADPNLVLPTGIAAIHLASGKENECALRCLTLILQYGGNPNVRCIDDLTPVHVAASWGCCKALSYLLRQGGDPSIQDQDGHTALDLALMENNRRCFVALQEYKERISDKHSGEMDGCRKNNSSLHDITELSFITLPLDSSYENSLVSSTKISPLYFPKDTTSRKKHLDNAVILSQVEMPLSYSKDEPAKEQEMDSSYKLVRSKCEFKATEEQVAVPVTRAPQTSEFFSFHRETDTTLHNSKDVTSPDHVYSYNKEYGDENMEKTLIMWDNFSKSENLEKQETYSKHSDCNTSLLDGCDSRWVSDKRDNSFQNSDGNDACNQSSEDATIDFKKHAFKTMNAQSSGIVDASKEVVEKEELRSACTQMISSERKGTLTAVFTNKTVRTSDTQGTLPSPTIPIEATYYEHGCQDLQIHLRNLLLSTKECHRNGSEAACADTVLSGKTKSLQHDYALRQRVKDESSLEDTVTVESYEQEINKKVDSELEEDLKKIEVSTRNFHSQFHEDKSLFFTPRTKSRLHSFKLRQDTSSLFEDSVEMPKRGRRVRSPNDRMAASAHIPPECLLSPNSSGVTCKTNKSDISKTLNNAVSKNLQELTLTNKIPQKENFSESDTNLSISNFLTDDLSSETEVKPCLLLKQPTSNNYDGILDSAWLTEDGESEISGVTDHENRKVSSTIETAFPTSLVNESYLHSTLIENTAVSSCKPQRYSFSRLSCIPKADVGTTQLCLGEAHDSISQEVPLSPGGRPVNVSQVEPVEYIYKDNEKGHVLIEKHIPSINQSSTDTTGKSDNTIIYDWRNYKINNGNLSKASSINSPNRVAVELYRLSNDEIANRLKGLGEDPGQVTSQNRKMCILLLDKCLKEHTSYRPTGFSFHYSPELSLAMTTFNIPDCNKDEAELSQEFDQPDKTKKWREGVLKCSFNYLLLDPRVTQNLPSRCYDLSQLDCFRTFISAVFYVGKGKRSRPYCHLYEALNHYKGICKQPCSKVQHITDIWKSGSGVLSLHCFQNAIPVEAYTREACMVDAIGLKMLTNQKKGIYYGQTQSWTPARRRRLGVHMLYKAMQIFLAEGERQLRPPDIR
ncbi:ankyrin repeat and LEM domain-containing protein 1 [Leptodactylus fuscus]|uniref:ankyrin repeat and LEM domain-containing protein 1 n=1 Tax=Leptodactylus fuscus TaxID=238119 RepID=UPI003F4E9775